MWIALYIRIVKFKNIPSFLENIDERSKLGLTVYVFLLGMEMKHDRLYLAMGTNCYFGASFCGILIPYFESA